MNYKILGSDGKEYGPVPPEQINQWIAQSRLEKKSPVRPDGAKDWVFLGDLPEFAAAFAPPLITRTTPPPLTPVAAPDSGLNKVIPYKNVAALMAYYFGVFSVLPMVGLFLGIAAFILGIIGLKYRRANPQAGGTVHAWIGIVMGGLFGLLWLALIVLAIVVPIMAARHH